MRILTNRTAVLPGRGWAALFAILIHTVAAVLGGEELRLLEVRRIWDQAAHNAFTDLVLFEGNWFCTFREGSGHVSPDGAIRILISKDGREWKSAALLKDQRGDLRDPKLAVTPDKKMMLLGAVAMKDGAEVKHENLVWFSEDGKDWGAPVKTGEENIWLWKVSWKGEQCFGVGYATDQREFVRLYRGDGRRFEVLVPELFSKEQNGKGYPNESALFFMPGGEAYCLLRRDADSGSAQLGNARPPFTNWTWIDLGQRIGGPEVLVLPDSRVLAAGRFYDGKVRTSLAWLDVQNGELEEALRLPSGGDTSYPGLALDGDTIWVSYYSSHEGKTSIYLAQVAMER